MPSKSSITLRTVALIVVLVLAIGTFLTYKSASQQVAAQGFTLPCTVATYGNAWNGTLAFGLAQTTGSTDYLVVMNSNGTLLDLRTSTLSGYGVVKNIDKNILMFQGEPQVDGATTAPTYATNFWNVSSGAIQSFPNVIGHHDIEYDPLNNTFLTLQDYVRQVGSNFYLIDKIVHLDAAGNVLWSWDAYNYLPLSQADPFNLTSTYNGQTVSDFTHANALDWDYAHNIIYVNIRNTNTFYKINQTTGNIIWGCGQFGNFTLTDANGNVVPNLWYHSHDLQQVAPDVFTMFNDDLDNLTNPNDANSQMIEFTLNEQNMTAKENWSFTAPEQYYTQYLGGTDILPNGDWIGDFGSPTHQFPQNKPWNFNDTGAVIIEANPAGQIVRTITFPAGWLIYRIDVPTNITQITYNPSSGSSPSPTSGSPAPSSSSPTASSVPSSSPTVSSSPSPSPLTSSSTAPSLTPSLSQSPIPSTPSSSSPSTQPSSSPSPASNFLIITDVAFVIIAVLVTVIAVLVYTRKRNRST